MGKSGSKPEQQRRATSVETKSTEDDPVKRAAEVKELLSDLKKCRPELYDLWVRAAGEGVGNEEDLIDDGPAFDITRPHAESTADSFPPPIRVGGKPTGRLDLELKEVTLQELEIICGLLARTSAVTEVLLGQNELGHEGMALVADALRTNNSIRRLDLDDNDVGDDGVEHLASAFAQTDKAAVKGNTTLEELWLRENHIGSSGARILAQALSANGSLKKLNLQENDFGDVGAKHIAKALQSNTCLDYLNLSRNEVGDDGAEPMGKVLKTNRSLRHLYLTSNLFGDRAVTALADALGTNNTLVELTLDSNQVAEAGASRLLEALESNSRLTNLDVRPYSSMTQATARKLRVKIQRNKAFNQRVAFLLGLNRVFTVGDKAPTVQSFAESWDFDVNVLRGVFDYAFPAEVVLQQELDEKDAGTLIAEDEDERQAARERAEQEEARRLEEEERQRKAEEESHKYIP